MATVHRLGSSKANPHTKRVSFSAEGVRLIRALILIVVLSVLARLAFGSVIIELAGITAKVLAPHTRIADQTRQS